MDTEPEPTQGSTEPMEDQGPERVAQRKSSAGNAESVDDTVRHDIMSDHAATDEYESKGSHGHVSNRTAAQHHPPERSRRVSVRTSARLMPAERNSSHPYPPSGIRYQESSNLMMMPRGEQLEQANIIRDRRGDSRWDELPDRVDVLSADISNVLATLRGLQQDKHERVALQRKLQEAHGKLRENTVDRETSQKTSHENMALQKELQETRERLQRTRAELDEVRKNWKKVASQLGQVRAQAAASYQLYDSELVARVSQLRYNIRAFSLQYFMTKSPGQRQSTSEYLAAGNNFLRYLQETTPGSDNYRAYLMCDKIGPIVIQSFLWRLLVGETFDRFCWVPSSGLRKSATHLCQELLPCTGIYSNPMGLDREVRVAPEVERKFQMWKATTSALLLEFIKEQEEGGVEDQVNMQKAVEKFYSRFCNMALEVIEPFVRSSDEAILRDLQGIVENAIALDQEVYRQAARVEWIFPPPVDPVPFDPDYMVEAGAGEVTQQPGRQVGMVITPALKKRGTSTGENFDTQYLLLKMDVTCMP